MSERDIVVTIPKARIAAVEAEERHVAERIAKGGKGWSYYWTMGRLPKVTPRRVYFLWDGAVRAFHYARFCAGPYEDSIAESDRDVSQPAIILDPAINEIEPIPMRPFRGFRYFDEEAARAAEGGE